MEIDDRLIPEIPQNDPLSEPAYEKPRLSVLGDLNEITRGPDCGSLDLPGNTDGFGCALS